MPGTYATREAAIAADDLSADALDRLRAISHVDGQNRLITLADVHAEGICRCPVCGCPNRNQAGRQMDWCYGCYDSCT